MIFLENHIANIVLSFMRHFWSELYGSASRNEREAICNAGGWNYSIIVSNLYANNGLLFFYEIMSRYYQHIDYLVVGYEIIDASIGNYDYNKIEIRFKVAEHHMEVMLGMPAGALK